VKNKLTDIGAGMLISQILDEQYKNEYNLGEENEICTINLSSNMITEKIVDLILKKCKY